MCLRKWSILKLADVLCLHVWADFKGQKSRVSRRTSWLTFSCAFASFCMLSNVYFSDLLWRILKSRDPLLDSNDSSSSIMSFGVLCFFPRSISYPDQIEIEGKIAVIVNKTERIKNINKQYLCVLCHSIIFILGSVCDVFLWRHWVKGKTGNFSDSWRGKHTKRIRGPGYYI